MRPAFRNILEPEIPTRLPAPPCGAIVAVMLAQTVFLLWGCDWDLCGDEAEYWAWSRKLDWSYFSRGPVVAWLIRLGTELLGGLSLKLTGSLMFAVRFPCVILGGLTAWAVYRLAVLTTSSQRTGLIAVLLLPAIPIFALGGVIVTSDTPLVCCWAWAAVWSLSSRAKRTTFEPGSRQARSALSASSPNTHSSRSLRRSVCSCSSADASPAACGLGFWVMSLLSCGLGLLPIGIWNAQHGWAGGHQLADRVGLSSRAQLGQHLAGPQLSRGRSRCARRDLVDRRARLPSSGFCTRLLRARRTAVRR